MLEESSYWVLQEVFVDSGVAGNLLECELNLKTASSLKKDGEGKVKVTVEISGSLICGHEQIANVRFANVTKLSLNRKVTRETILKRVTKKKVEELISFLPLYLLKAGVVVKELSYEL
jgi:hypothetical protein